VWLGVGLEVWRPTRPEYTLLTMSVPMRAIHSLAAPPGPTPARPPLRRGAAAAAAASPLRRSSDPQPSPPTPPGLASRRAALLALVLAAAPARPAPAAAAFSLGIRTTASLPWPASSLRIAVAGPLTIFPSCPVGAVQLGRRSCCGSRRRNRRPSSSRPSPPPATPSSKLKLSSVISVSRVTIALPNLS